LLKLAQNRLKELLGLLSTHHYGNGDFVNAAIYAMALRQLSPAGYVAPGGPDDPGSPHDISLHQKLNALFGMQPPKYAYQACDSLLEMIKHELAQHGIIHHRVSLTQAEVSSWHIASIRGPRKLCPLSRHTGLSPP
jgi:hypothetical protein